MDTEEIDVTATAAPLVTDESGILELVRAKLARDLHDAVGQSLNSLLIRIRLAIAQGEVGMDELKRLELTAQQALAGARSVAYGLRELGKPDPLADAREYALRILSDAGCSLFWVDDRTTTWIDADAARELAVAIRESATNIARHASAKEAWIGLQVEDGRLRVSVRDDGVGFVPDTVRLTPDGRGLGLLGNAERLVGVGGSFDVLSIPGGGTTVLLEVPLHGARKKGPSKRRLAPLLDIHMPEPAVAATG